MRIGNGLRSPGWTVAIIAGAALGGAAVVTAAVLHRTPSSSSASATPIATPPIPAPPAATPPHIAAPPPVAHPDRLNLAEARASIEKVLGEVAVSHHAAILATRPSIPAHFRAETRVALAVVLRASGFATGGEGDASIVGIPTICAAYLADAPDGADAAAWLADHAPPPGQLYAYWLLRELDPDRVPALRTRLVADRREVTSLFGCVRYDRPIADFVAELDGSSLTTAALRLYPDQLTALAGHLHDILARPVPAPTKAKRRP